MIKRAAHIAFLMLTSMSCSLFNDDERVAKVGDHVLTMKELSGYIPNYLSAKDSALWADDYVKKWVQQELLLLKAQEKLSAEMKDVNKELEEYRNSLLIYRYKNLLIREKMDTTVSESAISEYYSGNRESFILNRNIVKAIFIKIPVQVSNPDNIKDLCLADAKEKLTSYCMSYAKAYDRFNDQWVAADLVLNNLPDAVTDQNQFLERNRFIERTDMNYYYIVCVRDYRLAGQVSPVEYVKNDIRNLILSKQKMDFLKQIEKDTYQEGVNKNEVKLYKIKNNRI
jgi:ribosomal protein L9